jgi:hypothetical protein
MVDLADAIRLRLLAGLLPRGKPSRTWSGKPSGGPCDGCSHLIGHPEVEYECDFPRPMPTFRFHRECIDLWGLERARLREGPTANAVRLILFASPHAFCAACLVTKAGTADEAIQADSVPSEFPLAGVGNFFVGLGVCHACGKATSVLAYRFVQGQSADGLICVECERPIGNEDGMALPYDGRIVKVHVACCRPLRARRQSQLT